MDEVAPEVTAGISGKKKFTEPWMIPGIENLNNQCQRLCKETLKKNCSAEMESQYKSYQNALNRLKHHAKQEYYTSECLEYEDNIRNCGN